MSKKIPLTIKSRRFIISKEFFQVYISSMSYHMILIHDFRNCSNLCLAKRTPVNCQVVKVFVLCFMRCRYVASDSTHLNGAGLWLLRKQGRTNAASSASNSIELKRFRSTVFVSLDSGAFYTGDIVKYSHMKHDLKCIKYLKRVPIKILRGKYLLYPPECYALEWDTNVQ